MYYVNVNEKYYRFVDVPGNGNCFYYSVLRHQSLEQRFDKSDSASLRQYLSSVVSTCFRDDEVIQNLFELTLLTPYTERYTLGTKPTSGYGSANQNSYD